MNFLFQPPLSVALAALLLVVAAASLWRGTRLLRKGLRNPEDPRHTLWVVRGIRGGIVAIGLTCLGLGLLFGRRWLLVFGLIFLGEELFETGIMILALRSGRSGRKEED